MLYADPIRRREKVRLKSQRQRERNIGNVHYKQIMQIARKKWADAHPEYTKERRREWAKKFRSTRREEHYTIQAKWRVKVRAAVFDFFGRKCKRCGFSDVRALQLDHIKGGGSKERRGDTRPTHHIIYRMIRECPSEVRTKFQLLCANCNWIKRSENGEHGAKPMEVPSP